MNPFDYKKPGDYQVTIMASLAENYKTVYAALLAIEPSAERTLAIRKLQESRMWANVSILGITA
jgi:hypothetical protein